MNIRVIQDLNQLGYNILYLSEFNLYYVGTEFTPVNLSEHIENNEIRGKNITERIANFEANFQNPHTIHTMIDKLNESHFRFSNQYKWMWFTAS